MKPLLIFAFALIGYQSMAQVVVDGVNLNQVPDLEFIEIVGIDMGLLKKKLNVVVDYGQKPSWDKDSRVEKDGDVKTFQSMVQALNFFFNNGWDLENSYLVSSATGNGNVYHHLLRRKKD